MDRDAIADRIIQDHTVYAGLGGAVPLPIIDMVTVTAIQLDLVRALARVYDVPFDVATGKAIVASITGASLARLGASVLKSVPGVGSFVGGIAQVGFSGASTYAVGHLFRSHFSAQGQLADLDPEAALPIYQAFFERGKDVVHSLRPTRSVENTAGTLERLAKLRADQVINSEEFERLKARLLATG